MKRVAVLIIGLMLAGCGSNGAGASSPANPATRSIQSMWTQSDPTKYIDLSQTQLNQPFTIIFSESSGAICSCDSEFDGDESSGTFSFSNCSYATRGSGDPSCSQPDRSGTYLRTSDGLRLTDSQFGFTTDYH